MLKAANVLLVHEGSPRSLWGVGQPEVLQGILVLVAGKRSDAAEALLDSLTVAVEAASAAVAPTASESAPPEVTAAAAARLCGIASAVSASGARLLGSRPEVWRHWICTVALALKRVSRWTQPGQPQVDIAIEALLLLAAHELGKAGTAALQPGGGTGRGCSAAGSRSAAAGCTVAAHLSVAAANEALLRGADGRALSQPARCATGRPRRRSCD